MIPLRIRIVCCGVAPGDGLLLGRDAVPPVLLERLMRVQTEVVGRPNVLAIFVGLAPTL